MEINLKTIKGIAQGFKEDGSSPKVMEAAVQMLFAMDINQNVLAESMEEVVQEVEYLRDTLLNIREMAEEDNPKAFADILNEIVKYEKEYGELYDPYDEIWNDTLSCGCCSCCGCMCDDYWDNDDEEDETAPGYGGDS